MKAKDLENLREKVLTRTTRGRKDYILAEKGVFSIISIKYTKIIFIKKKISKIVVLYRCKSQHFRYILHHSCTRRVCWTLFIMYFDIASLPLAKKPTFRSLRAAVRPATTAVTSSILFSCAAHRRSPQPQDRA